MNGANRVRGSNASAMDMTCGSIRRRLLAFTLPIMMGNLFQQLYSMVDTAVVGRGVGAQSLAAVGAANPVTQLLLGLIIGMTSGMSVVIAQHYGAGNRGFARRAIANGLYLILALTASVTAIGLLCCRQLFRLIRTPEELLDGAVLYAAILFGGTATSAFYNYEASVLRTFGSSLVPLLFLIIASLMNIALDLIFVMVMHMGIAGVAAATVLSQLVSAVLCLFYMRKRVPEIRMTHEDWTPSRALMAQHLKTGIPMAFFQSLLAVSFLILQSALNALGSSDMASYTAASKMDTLVYQILGAFGTAVSTFVAQNYGKGELGRIREGVRKSLQMTLAVSVALTAFVYLLGQWFMTLFIAPQESRILASGLRYIRTTSLFFGILGVNYVVRFALIGVGKTIILMAVGLSEIATRAAVTFLLVRRFGFTGMIFASPACWFTSTALCFACYPSMMKKAFVQRKILPQPSANLDG